MYDNLDGLLACRAAFLMAAMGVQEVRVLNQKFGTHYPKSATELVTEKRVASEGVWAVNEAKFASVADVVHSVNHSSEAQIVDFRTEAAFKKGSIPTSHHLPYTNVWSNHAMKEKIAVL